MFKRITTRDLRIVQGKHSFTLAVFQKWILDYFLMYVVVNPTLGRGWSTCIQKKKVWPDLSLVQNDGSKA